MRRSKIVLSLLVTILSAATSFAENPPSTIPDEFYLAEIPGLSALGGSRSSWYFVRGAKIWTANRTVQIDKLRWPQWDTNQVPFSLVPQQSGFAITFFGEDGKIQKRVDLKSALTPGKSAALKDIQPAKFQIDTTLEEGRVVIKSPIYPWVERRQVFQCKEKVGKDDKLSAAKSLKSCVKTLNGLPANSQEQWYAEVTWPRMKEMEWKEWIGEQDRELRGIYRKAGHSYESRREEGSTFQVLAGVTQKEKAAKIEFPIGELKRAEGLTASATREEKSKLLTKQEFPNGAAIEIYSLAADAVDTRELKLAADSNSAPGIKLQFVGSKDDEYHLKGTEFEEARTGFTAVLRPWSIAIYGNYNKITSNRGESDSFSGIPGIDVKYNWESLGLKPYGFFETGTIHEGSTLSISEFQVGAYKHFSSLEWLEPGVGYHHYSLSGKNPGSSRLGTMDAFALGAQASSLSEQGLIRGQAQILISDTLGYGASLHWDRFLNYRMKDLRFFWGPSLGFYRYAAKASNRLQVEETFTEDRWKVGLEFGVVGPDYFGR